MEVLQWFVNEGDTVEQFDKIMEVQSDKVRGKGALGSLHAVLRGDAVCGPTSGGRLSPRRLAVPHGALGSCRQQWKSRLATMA